MGILRVCKLLTVFFYFLSCENSDKEFIWLSEQEDRVKFYEKKILINKKLYSYIKNDSFLILFSNFNCKDSIKIKIEENNNTLKLKHKFLYIFFKNSEFEIVLKKNVVDNFEYYYFNSFSDKSFNFKGKWKCDNTTYEFLEKNKCIIDSAIENRYYIENGILYISNNNSCYNFSNYTIFEISENSFKLKDADNNDFKFIKVVN